MTAKVLVPLDGSDKDRRVIPAAVAVADLADGDLHLIRVLDLPAHSLSPRARTMGAADAANELRREMRRSVQATADRLTAETGRAVTCEVAEGFDVAEVLIKSATWRDADLVVMATRAPGRVSRAVLGSVADRVMREGPRPVVLVPPGVDARRGEPSQIHRVLVPLDGSELAATAADYVLGLERAGEPELVLLEVITLGVSSPSAPDRLEAEPDAQLPDLAQAHADAERRLRKVAERLRADGTREVHVRVVEDIHPAAAITRVAREVRSDLIAMSTRGMSGVERLVLGSVAEAVVRDSDVPVLLVKPA